MHRRGTFLLSQTGVHRRARFHIATRAPLRQRKRSQALPATANGQESRDRSAHPAQPDCGPDSRQASVRSLRPRRADQAVSGSQPAWKRTERRRADRTEIDRNEQKPNPDRRFWKGLAIMRASAVSAIPSLVRCALRVYGRDASRELPLKQPPYWRSPCASEWRAFPNLPQRR